MKKRWLHGVTTMPERVKIDRQTQNDCFEVIAQSTCFQTLCNISLLPRIIICTETTPDTLQHSYYKVVFFLSLRNSFKPKHGSVVEHMLAKQKTWV